MKRIIKLLQEGNLTYSLFPVSCVKNKQNGKAVNWKHTRKPGQKTQSNVPLKQEKKDKDYN